jgi:hypothetical protein
VSRRGKASDPAPGTTPPVEETEPVVEDAAAEGQDLVEADPYDKLDGMTTNEATASSIGGSDQYPYLDKTALPLHERDLPVNSDAYGPSQADLNPAFSPKPEDGGPSKEDRPGTIEGTALNADDLALAAAQNAEDAGQEGAVDQVKESIEAGKEQQMDAEQVTADAQDRAPEGVDATTGQGTPTGPSDAAQESGEGTGESGDEKPA